MVNVSIELANVKIGILEAESAAVSPSSADLAREVAETCERLRGQLSLESVAELPSIRGVRAMFRGWGVDPARYRPSAEALLRRVVQGKGLYLVSNIVDLNNLSSIETGWPLGSYDQNAITPPVTLRLGLEGEKYEGIGKHVWHLAGKPVLADATGPFGSPISDSTRTRITETTRAIFVAIFAPANASDANLAEALARHATRLERWAAARIIHRTVLHAPEISNVPHTTQGDFA